MSSLSRHLRLLTVASACVALVSLAGCSFNLDTQVPRTESARSDAPVQQQPTPDTREPVTLSGEGEGATAKVALAGDYVVSWSTAGSCFYSASLDGDVAQEVFSASAATTGTNNVYGIPAGDHYLDVITGPAPSCGWTATFTPQ